MIVARIIKEIGAPVVLIGAPGKNFEMAQTIQEHVRRQNGSEAGLHVAISPEAENKSWPIRRGLAFAQACDLVVTPDTGPAWAVAFEPMPKVMLLSHASPENITKWWINTTTLHAGPEVTCWSCHRLHDSKDTCTPNREGNGAACISDISVECLMTAIKAAWGCQSSLARMRSEWASHAILPATPVGSDTSASAKPAPDIACDATSIGSSRSIDRDSKSANGGAAMGKPSTPQIAQPAMSGQELITPTIAPNAARSGKPDGNNTPSMSDD
jgi:hypothetical protein